MNKIKQSLILVIIFCLKHNEASRVQNMLFSFLNCMT